MSSLRITTVKLPAGASITLDWEKGDTYLVTLRQGDRTVSRTRRSTKALAMKVVSRLKAKHKTRANPAKRTKRTKRKDTPTQTKAKAYLRALANSRSSYHLDDDPVEIFGKTKGEYLKRGTSLAFKALGGDKTWTYYVACMKRAGKMP
jgi:hypothetical protein